MAIKDPPASPSKPDASPPQILVTRTPVVVRTARWFKPERPSNAREALALGGKAVVLYVGLKLGISILKKTGSILFKGGKKSQASDRQQRTSIPTDNPLQGVPPSTHWHPLSCPPPALPPPEYQKIVSVQLPCSVYDFYCQVLSDQSNFMQQQHQEVGEQWDFVKRGWSPSTLDLSQYPYSDDQSALQAARKTVFEWVLGPEAAAAGGNGVAGPGFMRTISFTQPKKPPSSVDSHCVQRQQFAVYAGGVLVMSTAMNMLNIPFKDCFTVNTVWEVRPDASGNKTCTLNLYSKVHFVKGCLVSRIIKATTHRDLSSFYTTFMNNAAAALGAQPTPQQPTTPTSRTATRDWWSRRAPAAPSVTGQAPPGSPASHVSAATSSTLSLASSSQDTSGGHNPSLAHTMSVTRQLRVLVVMLVLAGSVVHQMMLHQELAHVHTLLHSLE